jgi:energy-coupling factor transporter transmembrane protein EcfT
MYPDKLEFKGDPLTRIDPRCRIAAGIMLIFAALHLTNFFLLAGLISAAFFALFQDAKTVLRRLAAVNTFCAVLFITMPLSGNSFTAPLLYTLRVNAAALFYMLFAAALGIGRLAPALAALKVNEKLVALLILTYRYLFVMYDRIFRSLLSMRLRRPRRAAHPAWRTYTALFAAAFADAFIRTQKINRAAQARGFDGVFPITRTFRWKTRDTLALLIAAVVSILLLFVEHGSKFNSAK